MGLWLMVGFSFAASLMVGFGFAAGLMDGFRFYRFVVMGLPAWVCGGLGLWVWICRHGFVVDRWWLCAMCGGFAGMVIVGGDSMQCVVVYGYGGCGFAVDRF